MGTIRPEDAANYLITLYKQTKYRCDHRKLQKLVIMADIISFQEHDERLIDPSAVSATINGLSIARLCTDVYKLSFNSVNDDDVITDNIDDNPDMSLHFVYNYNPKALEDSQREPLFYIFKQFGAYSGDDLTRISTESWLWKYARGKASDKKDEAVPINNEMYSGFINFIISNNSEAQSDFRSVFVSYLKKLLQDYKNKYEEGLEKYKYGLFEDK